MISGLPVKLILDLLLCIPLATRLIQRVTASKEIRAKGWIDQIKHSAELMGTHGLNIPGLQSKFVPVGSESFSLVFTVSPPGL